MIYPQQDDVLVITRNRGFWSTDSARVLFPHYCMLPERPMRITYLGYFVAAVFRVLMVRPRVIIIGTTTPLSPWFARMRRMGLFKNVALLTDHQFLTNRDAAEFDGVWVYSNEEINLYDMSVRNRFHFFHYPSKLQLSPVVHAPGEYVFAGGNHKRDHESFLRAMDGLPYRGVVVTDRSIAVGVPSNCEVFGHMSLTKYLEVMAKARFVVIPLLPGDVPHGHGDISLALSLGKPVVTTRGASVSEYVQEGHNGLLVAPGDVEGYREAIQKLFEEDALFNRLEEGARASAPKFSYETFADNLCRLIADIRTKKKS